MFNFLDVCVPVVFVAMLFENFGFRFFEFFVFFCLVVKRFSESWTAMTVWDI